MEKPKEILERALKMKPADRLLVLEGFIFHQDNIVILAIAHQHRKPGYWIEGQSVA